MLQSTPSPNKAVQLELLPTLIIKKAHMVADDSPRKAFYHLRLEQGCAGCYWLQKESGAGNRVWDRRTWHFTRLDEAQKRFDRILRQKLNPARKSPRIYRLESDVDDKK